MKKEGESGRSCYFEEERANLFHMPEKNESKEQCNGVREEWVYTIRITNNGEESSFTLTEKPNNSSERGRRRGRWHFYFRRARLCGLQFFRSGNQATCEFWGGDGVLCFGRGKEGSAFGGSGHDFCERGEQLVENGGKKKGFRPRRKRPSDDWTLER